MRVFVAGASGAIGRRLVPMLIEEGHEVLAMTSSRDRAPALRSSGAEPVVCDALDRDGLRDAVADSRPEVVVNQVTRIPDPFDPSRMEEQLAENDRLRSEGTRNLADAAAAAGARRMVSQSIAFAYRLDGEGPSGEDEGLWLDAPWPWRRSVEALRDLEESTTRTPGIEGVVLRYGQLYGPGTAYSPEGSVAAGLRRGLAPVPPGRTSFTHVDDAARAAVIALTGPAGIYNVVDDEPASPSEWVPALCDALGLEVPPELPPGAPGPRGASNALARARLGFAPRFPSWREGFGAGLA